MASGPSGAVGEQVPLVRELTPRRGQPIAVEGMTVLVGPSAGGRTATLHDIVRLAARFEPGGQDDPTEVAAPRVLQDLSLHGKLSLDRLIFGLTRLPATEEDERIVQGFGPDLRTAYRRTVGSEIKNILNRPLITARAVSSTALGELMPLRALMLEADQRLVVLDSVAAIGPQQSPESLLQALQDAPAEVHDQLDEAFGRAFPGQHLLLDDTRRVELTLRVAGSLGERPEGPIERVEWFEQFPPLERAGHDQRAFAAIVLALLLGQGRIVLIDQPELFLHPQTSRVLGRWLAERSGELACQLFVATNSGDFLQGLWSGPSKVTVVRCLGQEGETRLEAIPLDAGLTLARHPLLAAQQALSGLFAERVVVVPENSDAVIYARVARSEVEAGRVRMFHSYGPRQLAQIANVWRRTGVSLGVVAGLDMLQNERRFATLVEAVSGQPPPQPWLATRERLARHVELDRTASSAHEVENLLDQLKQGDEAAAAAAAGREATAAQQAWQRFAQRNLDGLPPELRLWVEELLDELKQLGIFVSTKGSTEAWLRDTLAGDARLPWLIRALQTLDSGPVPADLRAFVAELVTPHPSSGLRARED